MYVMNFTTASCEKDVMHSRIESSEKGGQRQRSDNQLPWSFSVVFNAANFFSFVRAISQVAHIPAIAVNIIPRKSCFRMLIAYGVLCAL